jgi:hypothetical protein
MNKQRLLVSLLLAVAAFAHGLAGAGEHPADGKMGQLPTHPDPFLANYYQTNAAEIEKLRAVAVDVKRSADERLKALQTLRAKFPDPAVAVAAELVADKSEKIAALAVTLVTGAAAMSNHRAPDDAHASPAMAYMMRKHELAKDALRKVVADPRATIRKPAASTLASLSDEKALEKIAAGAQAGVYNDAEAVKLYGLARTEASGKYLVKYLDPSKPAAIQAAAVRHLAESPRYRTQVRDTYLYNPKAPMEARVSAARVLAKDPATATPLLANPQAPPELYEAVLDSYLQARGAELSPAQIEYLKKAVQNYRGAQPAAPLKGVEARLLKLQKAKSP